MDIHPKPAGPPLGAALDYYQPDEWHLSGPWWVKQYPTSTSIKKLADGFREKVQRFYDALLEAKAHVHIAATYRPPQRAYLMHYAYLIAKRHLDPGLVPNYPGVQIRWQHLNSRGHVDLVASRHAAQQMVKAYAIAYAPVLESRHTKGLAIDMTITWEGDLKIHDGKGALQTITGTPRNGGMKHPPSVGHPKLHEVGKSYGVLKLKSDPPHWSSDGH
jgi:hypothetical protein